MNTTDALRLFEVHHVRITAMLDLATELAGRPPVEAREPLAKARWTVARHLRECQCFKHTEIFDAAIRYGNEQQAAQARLMAERCIATGEAFTDYVRRWASQDVVAQWAVYRPAMLAMVARLRRTLASEKTGITALLAGSERTRRLRA